MVCIEYNHQKLLWLAVNLIIFKWSSASSSSSKDGLYALSPLKVSVSSHSPHAHRRVFYYGCHCTMCVFMNFVVARGGCWMLIHFFVIRSNCIVYRAITRNHATWRWWWDYTFACCAHNCLLLMMCPHCPTDVYVESYMRINQIYFVNWMMRAMCIYFIRAVVFCCIQVFCAAAFYATNHVNLFHVACRVFLW